ncbi:hypothetical protein DL93DRAFT_2229838 [Clavulina sp. PMI_390]|nr:hypothetical protein DL93DRAFT_2229838 [Clavulina sp. PMI_390]
MWFLNPGRDALYAVLKRLLEPYVENLDLSKFQAGLWAGQFSVNNLTLKKSALDKFRLPIDVIEGHLGHLTLNIPWATLTSKPAEVIIEDLYLLAIPAAESKVDLAEDEERAQASKQERLKNAEVLRASSKDLHADDDQRSQGVFESLIAKIVNNVQITVKNIHIRYEDKLSVPGHPFAVGVTLAEFTAVSTDDTWEAAFIQSTSGAVRKLGNLDSLAVYFNTDSASITDSPRLLDAFRDSICHSNRDLPDHQFILKPVTSQGRITINHRASSEVPKIDAELTFDEIGFVLDSSQYRDAISMVDMYHFYLRQYQYRKYRPAALADPASTEPNREDGDAVLVGQSIDPDEGKRRERARLMLRFACDAIRSEVHDRKRRWTWEYLRERRDDRRRYVELYKRRESAPPPGLAAPDQKEFDALERKLTYEDIRFYRSIGRSQLRKERATAKREAAAQQAPKQEAQSQGWLAWAWGSGNTKPAEDVGADGMTDEQRKELYAAIDYDQGDEIAAGLTPPRDLQRARINAQLRKGSLALRRGLTDRRPDDKSPLDVISVIFDDLNADILQRPDNIDGTLTLGAMHVFDGTTPGTRYPEIIRMKGSPSAISNPTSPSSELKQPMFESHEPFFSLKVEHNPLDDRADNAVTMKMRAMEVIYHRGYLEAIFEFLKPPESQLESVAALLNAANETIEGLRNQTRAGFEYALQNHKTIDVKLDMNAPIIIIPEDVTSAQCLNMVLDAGHISVESNLADKAAIQEVHSKKNRSYTSADFERLESLMYDNFSVRLNDAQLLIGDNIDVLLAALSADRASKDSLHLLERIDMEFKLQMSIVADALNLTRFKVAGKLPTLAVNVSNSKYNGLMRIIDVSIPHFGGADQPQQLQDEMSTQVPKRPQALKQSTSQAGITASDSAMRLPSNLFGAADGREYTIHEDQEDDESSDVERPAPSRNKSSIKELDKQAALAKAKQKTFEFSFQVGKLQASLSKTDAVTGVEALLATGQLEHFTLDFSMSQWEMAVDLLLQSISLDMIDRWNGGSQNLPLLKSATDEEEEREPLVRVQYLRVQPQSPEFSGKFESIDQHIDIQLSTFVFSAAPRPVIALYDFLMVTFVSGNNAASGAATPLPPTPPTGNDAAATTLEPAPQAPVGSPSKIRLKVGLTGVRLILLDGSTKIATLELSQAKVALLLAGAMRVDVQLGNLLLIDDSSVATRLPEYKELITIEGSNLLDLTYETFGEEARAAPGGVDSAVTLRSGSVKVHFLEQPLHDLYGFLIKFARLKSLYDSATQVAAQRAAEIEIARMKYDVVVQSPIIVFPDPSMKSDHVLTMRLGEVSAKNEYGEGFTKIQAGLHGISLTSAASVAEEIVTLSMVDAVDIDTVVIQHLGGTPADAKIPPPETEIHVAMSDVRMALTQNQYIAVMGLLQSVPRVLALDEDESMTAESVGASVAANPPKGPLTQTPSSEVLANLAPEIRPPTLNGASPTATRAKMDFVFQVKSIRLNLYNANALRESDFKETGIARFAINENTVRAKMLADGALEAEVVLRTFTMTNTRPGKARYREVIPPEKNREQPQVMILYTSSGASTSRATSYAVVTVDSPKILFALDPMFALLNFFMSAFPPSETPTDDDMPAQMQPDKLTMDSQTIAKPSASSPPSTAFAFRFDLHDASVTVLEDDEQVNSQAIRLSIKQISLSQQNILALTVKQLGMSLVTMQGMDGVRFLDDVDITLSMDSTQSVEHQMTSIELAMRPVTLRASIIDLNLISTIALRALALYGEQSKAAAPPKSKAVSTAATAAVPPSGARGTSARHRRALSSISKPKVHLSKEKLKARFEGFRFVLIGSRYELPAMHMNLEAFEFDVSDWSSELKAQTSVGLAINYWNLLNSHWEPLIDPWAFSLQLSNMPGPSAGLNCTLSSRDRLDLNISASFIEMMVNLSAAISEVAAKPQRIDRVDEAPFRIRNRSGVDLMIWRDTDSNKTGHEQGAKIKHEQMIDWRFDDSRTLRERLSSGRSNSLRIQLQGTGHEAVRGVSVDHEGEFVYILRPRKDGGSDRLLVEVRVQRSIKIITIRSTYLVQNRTLYPLELMMVDASGATAIPVQKIAPGNDFAVPLEAVTKLRLKIRPDGGFGFNWCADSYGWEDLVKSPELPVACRARDGSEAPFRFQVCAVYDRQDPTARKYPKINLILRAPIELENLLPYDVNYRVYDKSTNQNWTSYLRKGGVMPVHSVRLDHMVLLNIDLDGAGFKPSDFAIINPSADTEFGREKNLTLHDKEGRQMNLRLNYFKYPDSAGAFKVQIYSPFVLINHTGLPFTLRSGSSKLIANQNNPNVALHSSTPFMFSHAQSSGNDFSFRVRDSAWSRVISFEAPSAETEVTLEVPGRDHNIHVGVSWKLGLGKYKLTKVVTLAPRFILVNNLSKKLCFREHGADPPSNSILEPGAQTSLQIMRPVVDKLITITYPGLNAQWSAPVSIGDVGTMHVRVFPPGQTSTPDLVKVVTAVEGATIFVYFDEEKGPWPFRIENNSEYAFKLAQSDDQTRDDGRDSRRRPLIDVPRHSAVLYAWDYPSATNKKLRLISGAETRDIDILEIGDLIPFKFRQGNGSYVVSLDVRAENGGQTLSISKYDPKTSLYQPRRRSSSASRASTLMGSDAFEATTEEIRPSLSVTVNLEGIGISLINKRVIELLYLSSTGIKLEYTDSYAAQTVNLTLDSIQLDNQLHDAIFPVVLQTTPLPKNDRSMITKLPAVQASVMMLKDDSHGVLFIKYASILLQALTVRADEDFLFALLDFTKVQGASWEEETPDILIEHPDGIPRAQPIAGGQELYFEVLELQPIRLTISFERAERVNAEEKVVIRNPVAVVINSVTMALGNVNEAVLELNALGIKDARMTSAIISDRVFFHYRQEVLRQLYRILGSVGFIGNPVGLFTNVSSGIADVFYEPYQGVVMYGNKELGIGLAKGAASFVKKTVFGVSESLNKITSSIGKGLSSATFDSEYQRQRRLAQRQNKPRHAIYGVTAGAEALATSVQSGIEGVVMKPIEGAEAGGAVGFFKGVGKGIVGVVAKPMVGMFDLAANVTEGIRNTTTVFDGPQRDRVRIPRHVPYDGVVTPYSQREALGQRWLRDLDGGRYREELYVAHLEIAGRDNAIMLTTTHVLSISCARLRVEWDLPFSQLQGVTVEDTGIRFSSKSGREYDHFVLIPKDSKMWFFKEIEKVVVRYNATRRVER